MAAPLPGPLGQNCSNCKYSWLYPNLPPNYSFCVRYPPTVDYMEQTGKKAARFPSTQPDWWCGEWDLALASLTYVSDWTFNAASYVPPPTSGRVRFNATTQNAGTNIIYVSVQDNAAADKTAALTPLLKSGKTLHFEDKSDPSRYKDYVLTADASLMTASPNYFQCAVSFLGGGVDIGSVVIKVLAG